MAENIILTDLTSTSSVPLNLVLDDYIPGATTESVTGEVYWRWEDTPTMEPQYLGSQTAGHTLAVPFDLQGKVIRLFLVSVTADGRRSVQDVREAEQTTFQGPTTEVLTLADVVLTLDGDVLTLTI